MQITHTNEIDNYLTLNLDKIGSGTATITVRFLQSNDNLNWYTVKKGAAQGDYTKTISLTADANYEYSSRRDTGFWEGRFARVQFITSSTASVKVKVLASYMKWNIK